MDAISFSNGDVIYRHPSEHSYVAGMHHVVSVHQTSVVLPRALQTRSKALVKNLCGKLTTFLQGYTAHRPVSVPDLSSFFGKHQTMHHLHGTATVHCGVVFFKGCAGFNSVKLLASDLFLESSACEVHMGVFKSCLGRRISTAHGCALEKSVSRCFSGLRVRHRMLENTQAVKLRIDNFESSEFPYLTGDLIPSSVDISITGSGVVLLRFSWSKCKWSDDLEASALRFCDWVVETLGECC